MNQNNRDGIKQQLVEAIDVVEFVRAHVNADWSGQEQDKIPCPMAAKRHEGSDDSTPSLSINPSTGAFNCYGCGWKGTSVVGLATDTLYDGDFKRCLSVLYAKYVRNLIPTNQISEAHKELLSKPRLLQKILATRGWTEDTIRQLKIGWNSEEKRTVIPIFNLQGYCVDFRLHDTLYRAPLVNGKRVPAKGDSNSRTGDWFPVSPAINPLANQEIWLLEGEPDCVLGTQDGLNCITVTGGAGAWKSLDHERLKVFHGKDVVLCLDNDKAGQAAAQVLSERLTAVGVHSLKNVVVPNGKDLSDYFLKHAGSAATLRAIAGGLPWLIRPTKRTLVHVPLSESSQAKYIGKTIETDVIVSGKADAPQAIPSWIKLSCSSSEFCDNCPCRNDGQADYHVKADEPESLEWLYCRSYASRIKEELSLGARCRLNAEVLEYQNLEQVTLIPSLSNSKHADEGGYTTRRAYYIGHGIESNCNYRVRAIPTLHPRTKESVLLIDKASGTHDSLDGFSLSGDEFTRLKSVFTDEPLQTIKEVCEVLSRNHTHVKGRWEVHAAIDLVFHSIRDFVFADVQLPKGSIELLLFGDTRCGKGQVAEGLVSFYDLGQVVSGENASFMGLCGGAQKAGDNFQLSWGAIPINHGRLVIIDEFSGLKEDVIGRLSRVRSEGVAEINKGGINTRTRANTRLVWIANPRNGREVGSFSTGVAAIMDLIGTNEDVARFDLALVVQKGEVDVEEINRIDHEKYESKYTRELLRTVVLWAWSRKPEQIVFTQKCTEYTLNAAIELSQQFSATIPLIQGENVRFKIAKLAAAIAARCFSTEDGVSLVVKEKHAQLAVKLMHRFYSKPSMGYKQFSDIEIGTKVLTNQKELDDFFKTWPDHMRTQLIDGLLSSDRFGVRELQDWCNVDGNIAKKFVGTFVRCNAVKQLSNGNGLYVKKQAFITYLKEQKKNGQAKDGAKTNPRKS